MVSLFEKHAPLLEEARAAIRSRIYFSAYPDSPGHPSYGEDAVARSRAQLEVMRSGRFEIAGHPAERWVGEEQSPYGETLSIQYPCNDTETLVKTSARASRSWAAASVKERTGVCMEMLAALNRGSHLIANACQLTTGQPSLMAFQSGGPNAQERGLEAIAYAYEEMSRVPDEVLWEKTQGKSTTRLSKAFTLLPRGIAVVIGCATFPTWNSYGGLFADLCTGNSVILKPHPAGILPLAITARIIRGVLEPAGFDPNLVLLAPDTAAAPITQTLVQHPEVAIVDFTGGSEFGAWLRKNVRHALIYTEESGVNSIIIDSTDDLKGMCQSLALSLSLYSGQMCTAPQNLLVPRSGIETNEGHKSLEELATAIRDAVRSLLDDPRRAEVILGAIQTEQTLQRIRDVAVEGPVLLPSQPVALPSFPGARTASPLIRLATAEERTYFMQERFGPISYLIATESTSQSIELALEAAKTRGAISMGVYSTRADVLEMAAEASRKGAVTLSCNPTGSVPINQNAAFSDFHVSGANPAGNASLTDSAFVANRFRVIARRTWCA
jgi:phenylacetic acid degradation protein paaN